MDRVSRCSVPLMQPSDISWSSTGSQGAPFLSCEAAQLRLSLTRRTVGREHLLCSDTNFSMGFFFPSDLEGHYWCARCDPVSCCKRSKNKRSMLSFFFLKKETSHFRLVGPNRDIPDAMRKLRHAKPRHTSDTHFPPELPDLPELGRR